METIKTPITGKENIKDVESPQLRALISFESIDIFPVSDPGRARSR